MDRTSFRIGKRIFATMVPDGSEVMIPVHPLELCFSFLESNPKVFFDYGGFTRRFGCLGIRLKKANPKLTRELLHDAWTRVSVKQKSRRR